MKTTILAAFLTAAALTGILLTAPMTVYADETETSTDQSVKQKNTGSGDSLNFNCGQNLIKAGVGEQACGQEDEGIIVTDAATDTDDAAATDTDDAAATDTDDAAATDTDDAAATDTDSLPNLCDLFEGDPVLGC
jgi:hypothetical protein